MVCRMSQTYSVLPGQGWQIAYRSHDGTVYSEPVLAWILTLNDQGKFERAVAINVDASGHPGEVGAMGDDDPQGTQVPPYYWHPDGRNQPEWLEA